MKKMSVRLLSALIALVMLLGSVGALASEIPEGGAPSETTTVETQSDDQKESAQQDKQPAGEKKDSEEESEEEKESEEDTTPEGKGSDGSSKEIEEPDASLEEDKDPEDTPDQGTETPNSEEEEQEPDDSATGSADGETPAVSQQQEEEPSAPDVKAETIVPEVADTNFTAKNILTSDTLVVLNSIDEIQLTASVNETSENETTSVGNEAENTEDNSDEAGEELNTTTTNNMFKILNSRVYINGNNLRAKITLGSNYNWMYVGGAEKAKADKPGWIGYTKNDEGNHVFDVPVSALDTALDYAVNSTSSNTNTQSWYDRTLTFNSEKLSPEFIDEIAERTSVKAAEPKTVDAKDTTETSGSMFSIIDSKLYIKNGKLRAKITLKNSYNWVYLGKAADAKSDEAGQIKFKEVEENHVFDIIVSALDTPIDFAVNSTSSKGNTSTADKTVTFKSEGLSEDFLAEIKEKTGIEPKKDGTGDDTEESQEEEPKEEEPQTPGDSTFDNATKLADGEYTVPADDFSFTGGSGKAKLTLEKVMIKDGKATATFKASSANMTHVYLGEAPSENETKALYDPDTKTCGTNVYPIVNQIVTVPVRINENVAIAARTTAMTDPHWVQYIYNIIIADGSEPDDPTAEDPATEDPTDEPTTEDPTDDTPAVTIDGEAIDVETGAAMFKVVAATLYIDGDKLRAKVTLSGTGYDYLYAGTKAEAEKADASAYIGFTKDADGKYVYDVPVSALDTPIPFASHSARQSEWYDRTLTFKSDKLSEEFLKQIEAATGATPSDTPAETAAEATTATKSSTNGSTKKVNAATSLADGTYTPDKFSFSGGSGKVTISCSKVTVKNGQAYATLVFSSPNYPYVKANGRKYTGSHTGSTSTFEVPVQLNANNKIIGMTTAMSMDHEIEYTVYIYIKGAEPGDDTEAADENAPELIGLKYVSTDETDSELFDIYRYEDDLTVIAVIGTANYLVVPEGAQLPEFLDDVVVIRQPVAAGYTASEALFETLAPLFADVEQPAVTLVGFETEDESLTAAGTYAEPDYAALLAGGCDLAVVPEVFADARVNETEDAPVRETLTDEDAAALKDVAERLSMLGVPVFVDRSADEETDLARAEWIKTYGVIFGLEDEAAALYEATVAELEDAA